tara:strand:+ start:6810 stop:7376 length:567 start_codon:yes stop_codon:yes gene_type:complete
MESQPQNQSNSNNFLLLIKTNKKKLVITLFSIILVLFGYFFHLENKENKNIKISENYNNAKILLSKNKKNEAQLFLIEIINKKNKFYSPSALNLIIDNSLANYDQTLSLFDKVLKIKDLDKEKKNLFRIKKALFISDKEPEIEILNILNPIINSDSVWREKAQELMVNYYISKGQLEKSKQFKIKKKN